MPNFVWTEHRFIGSWTERFPQWAVGWNAWREQGIGGQWLRPELPRGVWRPDQGEPPRVFVSHKQQDEQIARGVAAIAEDEGFEYWLDVEDPDLAGIPVAKSASAVRSESAANEDEQLETDSTHSLRVSEYCLSRPVLASVRMSPAKRELGKDGEPMIIRCPDELMFSVIRAFSIFLIGRRFGRIESRPRKAIKSGEEVDVHSSMDCANRCRGQVARRDI